jgi:hypothetical protein
MNAGMLLVILIAAGVIYFMMRKGGGGCCGHSHGEHNNFPKDIPPENQAPGNQKTLCAG